MRHHGSPGPDLDDWELINRSPSQEISISLRIRAAIVAKFGAPSVDSTAPHCRHTDCSSFLCSLDTEILQRERNSSTAQTCCLILGIQLY